MGGPKGGSRACGDFAHGGPIGVRQAVMSIYGSILLKGCLSWRHPNHSRTAAHEPRAMSAITYVGAQMARRLGEKPQHGGPQLDAAFRRCVGQLRRQHPRNVFPPCERGGEA